MKTIIRSIFLTVALFTVTLFVFPTNNAKATEDCCSVCWSGAGDERDCAYDECIRQGGSPEGCELESMQIFWGAYDGCMVSCGPNCQWIEQ